jgi:hypothetical protein
MYLPNELFKYYLFVIFIGMHAANLDIDLLRSFAAVADTGSFTAAAELVARTQSAVSVQIKRLEEIVGRRVFERSSRSLALTPAGEMLLGYARRILDLAGSGAWQGDVAPGGTLVLTEKTADGEHRQRDLGPRAEKPETREGEPEVDREPGKGTEQDGLSEGQGRLS